MSGQAKTKQEKLVADLEAKMNQANVDMIMGVDALTALANANTAANTAAANAKTKFDALNKKWNDRMV